jgi:hypothetical protein
MSSGIVAQATAEGPSESTSKYTIDGEGLDSLHNSCNSGTINITRAMPPAMSLHLDAANTPSCDDEQCLEKKQP